MKQLLKKKTKKIKMEIANKLVNYKVDDKKIKKISFDTI